MALTSFLTAELDLTDSQFSPATSCSRACKSVWSLNCYVPRALECTVSRLHSPASTNEDNSGTPSMFCGCNFVVSAPAPKQQTTFYPLFAYSPLFERRKNIPLKHKNLFRSARRESRGFVPFVHIEPQPPVARPISVL